MSSLVFLGLSVIMFVISYGLGFLITAVIIGEFFTTLDPIGHKITDPGWLNMYVKTSTTIQWLVPLVPTMGIFIFVLKVLMVASNKGRD